MAITYPIDIIPELEGIGWSTDFNLLYRQEQSRHASGRTRIREYGTPLWQATYTTKNLSPNNLDIWKARLNSLENGLNTFYASPMSRCWPINHPNGQGLILNSPKVKTKNLNNKAISLSGVNGLNLSIGDYISINDLLYTVMESVIANSSGDTIEFEVRPFLSVSITEEDAVRIRSPRTIMTLVPNSVNTAVGLNGRGSVSFQGIEARG